MKLSDYPRTCCNNSHDEWRDFNKPAWNVHYSLVYEPALCQRIFLEFSVSKSICIPFWKGIQFVFYPSWLFHHLHCIPEGMQRHLKSGSPSKMTSVNREDTALSWLWWIKSKIPHGNSFRYELSRLQFFFVLILVGTVWNCPQKATLLDRNVRIGNLFCF